MEELILKTCASVYSDKIEKLLIKEITPQTSVAVREIVTKAYMEAYNKGLNKANNK